MKKIYAKPSIAVSTFDMSDNTNVNILSSVGAKNNGTYSRTGISILDGKRLNS